MNGVQHLTANLVVGVSMTVPAIIFSQPDVAVGVTIGSFLGTIMTPDLDLNGSSLSKQILGNLKIRWMFYPYSKMFKHRSKWSHAPVLSTVIRWLYVTLLLSPLIAIVLWYGIEPNTTWGFWLSVGVAWTIQDFSHQLLDGILW